MDDSSTPPRRAGPSALATADAGETAAERRPSIARLHLTSGWGLIAILIIQALLSVRLVRADSAFQDESAYLWAGHLEWAHWLHGASAPAFSAYFSGAPGIYPPLGALADSLGGLTGARILSLAFMLGTTALLWDATTRLFGRRAAVFAAALFAVLGPTLHLGAFATYDAPSILLMALAAWFVVRASERRDATALMVAAGVAMALANATAYSSAVLDIVVVLLAFLIAQPTLGTRLAATRCLTLLIVAAVLLGAGLLVGGSSYVQGVDSTTVGRVAGGSSALTVLVDAWSWTGVIVVGAVCAVVLCWRRRDGAARTWLLAVLAVAALLGPLDQARLHTTASLDKHVAVGAWFAAMAAGYAIDRVVAAVPAGSTRVVTIWAFVVALAFPISLGATQSLRLSTDWPESASFVAILRPLVERSAAPVLVEDPSIAEYYLGVRSQWTRWSSTRNIVLPSGLSTGGPSKATGVIGPGNAGTFGAKIASGYFGLIALNFADTTLLDHKLRADIIASGHYQKEVLVVPYGPRPGTDVFGTYIIWQRK
jgi:Dolichyl-phosphate-mannose-protein mannosyltransferase